MDDTPQQFVVRPDEGLQYSTKASAFIPDTETTSAKRVRNKPFEKLAKILKIVLGLAQVNGYDVIGRIKTKNGDFLDKSNVIDLIIHSMSYGKELIGETEFINLLFEANISPTLIVNENIKKKLANVYQQIARQPAVRIEPIEQQMPVLTAMEPEAEYRRRILTPRVPRQQQMVPPPQYAYQPLVTEKRSLKRSREPEEVDITPEEGVEQTSAEPVAKKPVPPDFTPKPITHPNVQWLYPVDPIAEARSLPNQRTAKSKQKRREALDERRNLPAVEDEDVDLDEDQETVQ
jgi:hypothetical protein